MNSDKNHPSKAAEEIESDVEAREENRRESETDQQRDLNQGMQTGTGDAQHPGINWGSSYTTRSKTHKKKNSESKP